MLNTIGEVAVGERSQIPPTPNVYCLRPQREREVGSFIVNYVLQEHTWTTVSVRGVGCGTIVVATVSGHFGPSDQKGSANLPYLICMQPWLDARIQHVDMYIYYD